MKANVNRTCTVVLTLNEEEATRLKDMLQNGPEDEPFEQAECREELFNALRDALEH